MLKGKRVASMGGYMFVAALCAAFLFASPGVAAQEKAKPAGATAQGVAGVDPATAERLEKLEKFQRDFESYLKSEPTRGEAAKELVDGKLQAQDRLLTMMSGQIDRFSVIVSLLGIMIALGLGVASYWSYGKAVAEAREKVEEWFNQKEKDLNGRLKLLSDKAGAIIYLLESHKSTAESCVNSIIGFEAEVRSRAAKSFNVRNVSQGHEIDYKGTVYRLKSEKKESEYTAEDIFAKALDAYYNGKKERALVYFEDVVDFKGVDSVLAVRALLNKGVVLGDIGRSDDEFSVYDYVVSRFGDSTEPALQEQVAMALLNKGIALNKQGRSEEELAAYGHVVNRFGDSSNPAIQAAVGKARVNMGVVIGSMGRNEEAVAVLKDVLSRFFDSKEPAIQEIICIARVNMGVELSKLRRYDESLAAYEHVVSRFCGSSEPVLGEHVAMARNGIGFVFILKAKSAWDNMGINEHYLRKALLEFDRALPKIKDKFIALGNQGYSFFLLGRIDEARAPLLQALKDGGERLYKLEIEDSYIHPVPEDEDFRKLLAELWRDAHGTEPPVIDPPKKDEATPPSSS